MTIFNDASATSSVLLVEGHVAAMVMVYYDREQRCAHVPAKVVLPGFRGGFPCVPACYWSFRSLKSAVERT